MAAAGGESERDGGAFNHSATLVTVLAAVLDREVLACACSSEVTGGFLVSIVTGGTCIQLQEVSSSPSQTTHYTDDCRKEFEIRTQV